MIIFINLLQHTEFGGKKFGELQPIHQSFSANIPDEARGHAVCVMNVRHVKQCT